MPLRRYAIPVAFSILIVGLLIVPVAGQTAVTEQVSVSSAGAGGNELSRDAAISADGRFVAFVSGATNLAPGPETASSDVFVRDRQAATTERVPLPSGVTGPTGPPSITGDGRFVVFAANGPEPDVLNIVTHVYLHDRAAVTTERINVVPSNHLASYAPVISANGRFVAYFSNTDDGSQSNGVLDVLVYDTQTAQTSAANKMGDAVVSSPFDPDYAVDISGDGRIVAFTFGAAQGPGAPAGQVFVRDMVAGATTIASTSSAGSASSGGHYFRPAVSADGRFVAFFSPAALVAADTNDMPDTYVRDLLQGTTERVSVDSDEHQVPNGSNLADWPAISADGRFVAFASMDPGLTPGDTNQAFDVFVRDRLEGTTTRVSVASDGSQANNQSYSPSLSANGRTVAFTSEATNLSSNKNPASLLDVYVHETPSTAPPLVLSAVTPSVSELWPPNNTLVDVRLRYSTSGGVGQPVCQVTVVSSEASRAPAGRPALADWQVLDPQHVSLRATREGGGSGRIYTLTVTCTDDAAQTVSQSTHVTVPHDRRSR